MSTPFPGHGPATPPRSTPIPGATDPQLPPAVDPGQFGSSPFGSGPPGGDPFASGQLPSPRRSRGGLGAVWVIIGLVLLLSVGTGVVMLFVVNRTTKNAVDQVEDVFDSIVKSAESQGGSGGSGSGDTGSDDEEADAPTVLWEAGRARRFAEQYDAGIPGDPTRFVQMVIYPDYAFASAQDPEESDHVDRYGWRNGKVDSGQPEQNQDDLEGRTFTIADVPWDELATLMAQAEDELDIDDATNRYFIIDKDSTDGLAIRAYVSGPRESGYVLADDTATVVTVYGG